jgi:hypothetical protein
MQVAHPLLVVGQSCIRLSDAMPAQQASELPHSFISLSLYWFESGLYALNMSAVANPWYEELANLPKAVTKDHVFLVPWLLDVWRQRLAESEFGKVSIRHRNRTFRNHCRPPQKGISVKFH